MAAKLVATKLLKEKGISTIVVSDLFDTNLMSFFLKDISDSVVILFEEFEKIYKTVRTDDEDNRTRSTMGDQSPKDYQEGLLTLLDGVFNGKKLFMFTCNKTYRVNELLMNRPGRVFYHFKYLGVEDDVVRSYCEKNLSNPEYREQVVGIGDYLDDGFTFDMLKALVEESNRYGISPLEAIHDMNIEPDIMSSFYDVSVSSLDGYATQIPYDDAAQHIHNYLDPAMKIRVAVYVTVGSKKDLDKINAIRKFEEENYYGSSNNDLPVTESSEGRRVAGFGDFREERVMLRIWFTEADLKEKQKGVLIYEKHGFRVTFTRRKPFSLWKYL